MFERLKKRLEEETHLTDEDWSLLVKHIQYKELLKNEILLRPNEVATWSIFLTEGILRICNHYDGREYTRNIFTSGDFFTESGSFFSNKSFGFQIDALENSKIFLLPKDSMAELESKSEVFRLFFRKQLERALVFLTKRMLEGQLSGIEKYNEFRRTRPNLIGKIPQYILASYLNLTPEAYSRIQRTAGDLNIDQ
jgi:CRP-like cAMP-binding protein